MAAAKKGDKVKVSYVGKLSNESVFDKSPDGSPFIFTIGGNEMIPELEEAVIGMNPGESKKFEIPAKNAFGPHRKELVIDIPLERLPKGKEYKAGEGIELDLGGKVALAKIIIVQEDSVTIDANHPLAGQPLHFDLKLESIEA